MRVQESSLRRQSCNFAVKPVAETATAAALDLAKERLMGPSPLLKGGLKGGLKRGLEGRLKGG